MQVVLVGDMGQLSPVEEEDRGSVGRAGGLEREPGARAAPRAQLPGSPPAAAMRSPSSRWAARFSTRSERTSITAGFPAAQASR